MEGEITFGEFTLSSVVAILLGVTFQSIPTIPDRLKNLLALTFGLCLGLLGVFVEGHPWTAKVCILHAVSGVMYGVQAVGTYNCLKKSDVPVK